MSSIKQKRSIMSIQKKLDEDSLNFIPIVKEKINAADSFERIQMQFCANKAMINSAQPVISMSSAKLYEFQFKLIELFKYNNWIKS